MFINSVSTEQRILNKGSLPKIIKRVTDLGKFKDKTFTIDKYYENNELKSKRFVFWDDKTQVIKNKIKNDKTGKFDIII